MALASGTRLAHYNIVEKIGAGGMGDVDLRGHQSEARDIWVMDVVQV